jgi:hypothetical protein
MPGPTIPNLDQLIGKIAQHSEPLPPEAASPIEHYHRGANDAYNLMLYFERNVKKANAYAAVASRHGARLRSMVLLSIVEAFERYVKELAALCIDQVAPVVLDDRLSGLRVNARTIAAHFAEKSIGKALCEGDTWLDCKDISDRFGKLLADPFAANDFHFFPAQSKDPDAWRRPTMDTLFQLRHSVVHNVAVITNSDAAKLRLLSKAPVAAPRVLSPTPSDIWYVKVFVDETAAWANSRVSQRLAKLLTTIHTSDPALFVPQEKADLVAQQIGEQVTVAGATGNPKI